MDLLLILLLVSLVIEFSVELVEICIINCWRIAEGGGGGGDMNGDILRKGHSDWLITAVGNSNCSECHNFLFIYALQNKLEAL